MANKKDTQSTRNLRRKALKVTGVGGVLAGTLPASWTKPMVKSVILPAHAQTSPVASSSKCGSAICTTSGMSINILTATENVNGGLFVMGEADIPADCVPSSDYTRDITFEVVDNGVVIGAHGRSSEGGECQYSSATADGCLASTTITVAPVTNTLASGDCVTLRATFRGTCVCSAITTVT